MLLAVAGGLLGIAFSAHALLGGAAPFRTRRLAWWLIVGSIFLPATNRWSVANHLIIGVGLLAFLRVAEIKRELS